MPRLKGLSQKTEDLSRFIVDDSLGLNIEEDGNGDPTRVTRVGFKVDLAESLKSKKLVSGGEGMGRMESPAIVIEKPVNHGHRKFIGQSQHRAGDQDPMGPRTGPGDVKVIAIGLQTLNGRSECCLRSLKGSTFIARVPPAFPFTFNKIAQIRAPLSSQNLISTCPTASRPREGGVSSKAKSLTVQLACLVLYVSDLRASGPFYRNLLGKKPGKLGQDHLRFALGSGALILKARKGKPGEPAQRITEFSLAMDEPLERLFWRLSQIADDERPRTAKNAPSISRESPALEMRAVFRDPDGNLVELFHRESCQ